MKYQIVSSTDSPADLMRLVNAAIDEGWEPIGGVTVVLGTMYNRYLQAMIYVSMAEKVRHRIG